MGVFDQLEKQKKKSGGVFARLQDELNQQVLSKVNETRSFDDQASLLDFSPLNPNLNRLADRVVASAPKPTVPPVSSQGAFVDPNSLSVRPPTEEEAKQLEATQFRGTPSTPAQKFGNALSEGVVNAIDTAALNIPSTLARRQGVDIQSDTTAGKVGNVAGLLTGFGGAYKLTKGMADDLLKRGLGRQIEGELAAQGISNPRIAKELLRGGVAEGTYSTARELADAALDTRQDGSQSVVQRAKNVATDTAFGALGDAALFGAGSLLSNSAKRVVQKYRPEPEALQLPEGRGAIRMDAAQQRSVNPPGTEPIINEHTFGLPDATKETIQRTGNVKSTMSDLAEINNEIKLMGDRYEGAINEQYKFLKNQLKNREGTEPKGPIRNEQGDVVGYKRGFSKNPEWYQTFYAEHGKLPNNRELREIAKDQIDNGYVDFGQQIPPWKEQVGFDETVSALEGVRSTIRDSLKEMGTLGDNQLVDATLKTQEPKILPKTKEPAQPKSEPIQPEPEVADDLIQSKEPRIRDKLFNTLDEAEKAARERLKGKASTLYSGIPVDQLKDYGIIVAAKIGKGGIKLADATEELIKEFGESLRPHIDQITRYAREHIRNTERVATKEAEEAFAFNQSGKGNAESFRSKINRNPAKDKVSFSKKWERWKSRTIDDTTSLERLEKQVTGKVASAEDSLYKAARKFKGWAGKSEQFVNDRIIPVIRQAEKSGHTAEELGDYALAVHAKDVNAKGYKSGFTDAEIDDVIRRLGTEEMESARKELVKASDDLLDSLAKGNVISKDLLETLRIRWPNYMPLFRSMDDEKVEFVTGLKNAMANVTSPLKALEGSERQVLDPLMNMAKNVYQTTNSVERNQVALQLHRLARLDPDASYIRRLSEKETVGRKNVVSVLVNGDKVRYEVDPEVYKTFMDLDKESSNIFVNILSKPASLLRAGAVLTPDFSLRNPARDIVQAYVVSKSGFNLADFGVGLIQSIKKGDLYKEWVNELGSYGNIVSKDRNAYSESLRRVMKEKPSTKFVNLVSGQSLIRVLRAISDTTESATKVGEYRAALRKGVSKEEAAYRSRDIMDFARSGSSVRTANRVVAFFNANLQGKSKLIRAIKEDPVGTSSRIFKAVTLPTVAVFMAQKYLATDKQQQTINEAPDWMKNTFWLIPIPGTDIVGRFPKPFDLSVFANIPERALEFTFNHDKKAFDNFFRQSVSEMTIPIQITGLIPLIEGQSGYSFFMQRDIVPRGEQNRELKDQKDINTTETAKLLARAMRAVTGEQGSFKNFGSPRIMDNTIRGLTAGLGTYATSAIDAVLEGLDVVDKPPKPSKSLERMPLVKSFLVNPLQSGKSLDAIYELKDRLQKKKTSAQLNEESFKDQKTLDFLNDVTSDFSDINTKIRSIENSKKITSDEKQKQIEKLLQQRLKKAIEANKKLEKMNP